MIYDNFKQLFSLICEIKEFVLKLDSQELKKYKIVFFNQKFPEWRLDMMWEFFWDDIDYETMQYVFENKKII